MGDKIETAGKVIDLMAALKSSLDAHPESVMTREAPRMASNEVREMPPLLCDVHRSIGQDVPALGVCNALGPMSSAFCKECLISHRVTYGNLVGYLSGVEPLREKSDLAEWVHPTIDATLAFYSKTWEEFAKDCADAVREWEKYEATSAEGGKADADG